MVRQRYRFWTTLALLSLLMLIWNPPISFGASSNTEGSSLSTSPPPSQSNEGSNSQASKLSEDLKKNSARNDYTGSVLLGIQGGFGAPTQNIDSSFNSAVDYMLNFSALYGVTHFETIPLNTLAGLDVSVSGHPVNVISSGFNLGEATSISFLPTIELRTDKMDNWSFYGSFGIGFNANSFTNSASLNAVCSANSISCVVSPGTSLGLRVAVGTDYYVTQNLSLNAEMGYLYNDPTSSLTLAGNNASLSGSGQTNISTFFLLFGFDYRMWVYHGF